jgi:predicted PilT family ATPase
LCGAATGATCRDNKQEQEQNTTIKQNKTTITLQQMFEVEATLRDRLEQQKQEKVLLKNELNLVENKLQHLFTHLPSTRPRHTQQQLQEMRAQLEYQHTTNPQTNTEERVFMREMDRLKKKMKEEVEYTLQQQAINELKGRKSQILKELKEKELYLDELYQGTRKLKVSSRLGCEPNALIEHNISVPDDRLAHVIGRGGMAIKNIESECCVGIDVERGSPSGANNINTTTPTTTSNSSSYLRVIGLPGGVAIAEDKIRLILNTMTDTRQLSEPQVVCLLHDKASLLQQIQDRHNVRLDLSRLSRESKITGLTNDVQAALHEILSLDCLSVVMELEATILPFLFSKGGGVLRAIQNEHDISLEVNQDELTVTLIGFKPNVLAAKTALNEVINENKEIEDSISCERYALVEAIIGSKGSIIRQLQQEYGVGIIVAKEKAAIGGAGAEGGSKQTVESKLDHERIVLKGTTAKVLVAKQHMLDLIRDYNSNTEYVPVPDYCIPFILGKRGSNIQKLRAEHQGEVTIDVIPTMSSVRIHSSTPSRREQVKETLLQTIQNNSQTEYSMTRLSAISLKTDKYLSLRNYLTNELKMKVDIDVENEVIKLRGHHERFPLAITALDKYCDENFSLENIYSEEDFASFLSNNGPAPHADKSKASVSTEEEATEQQQQQQNLQNETLAKKIENDYSVKLYLNKKQNTIRITGVKFSVLAADDAISHILHGDSASGESVIIPMNSFAIGALIGKGGKRIREFERKHNVMIDILRSREQVRLRGTGHAVNEATKGLLQLIDKLRLSTILMIGKKPDAGPSIDGEEKKGEADPEGDDEEAEDDGTAPQPSHDKLVELANDANKYYGIDVTIQPDDRSFALQGTKKQIEYTKCFLSDQLRGLSVVELPILTHHYEHFQHSSNAMEKLHQIGKNFNLELSVGLRRARPHILEDRYVTYEHVILLQGPNHLMTKAKINIYRLLDYLFPAEFISIPIDNYILRGIWSDSLIARELSQLFPAASVTYDMIMSCLRIIGQDSMIVHQVRDHILSLLRSYAIYEITPETLPLVNLHRTFLTSQLMTKFPSLQIQLPTSHKLTFYLHTSAAYDDERVVKEARQHLDELVQRLSRENWQVVVSAGLIGALIGKQGANINKLRNETKANVEFDITTRVVKVSGKETAVNEAKAKIQELIAKKEAESYQLKLFITRECVRVIIGQKGKKIQEIRQVSGVLSIEIDKKTNEYVILSGRSVSPFPLSRTDLLILEPSAVRRLRKKSKKHSLKRRLIPRWSLAWFRKRREQWRHKLNPQSLLDPG